MTSYAILGLAIFLGAVFVGGAIFTSLLLAFRTPESRGKIQAYECAEDPVGDARIRFKVGFYIFALLFLVFDIEALLLFPVLVVFREIAAGSTSEAVFVICAVGFFVITLLEGLIYVWKKGVLRWE